MYNYKNNNSKCDEKGMLYIECRIKYSKHRATKKSENRLKAPFTTCITQVQGGEIFIYLKWKLFYLTKLSRFLSTLTLRPRNTYIYIFQVLFGFCNF